MAKGTDVAGTDDKAEWMVTEKDAVSAASLSDVFRSEQFGRGTITLDDAEQNAQLSFEEALERAGLTEEDRIIGSAFAEADKATLVGVPFLIVTCAINRDAVTEREYIVVRALTREDPSRMVVFTDGGTGFFQQMQAHIRQRLNTGQPAWEGYYIGGGLRVSEYQVVKDPVTRDNRPMTQADVAAGLKPDSTARTYYIA